MLGVALIFILSRFYYFLYPIRKPAEVREAGTFVNEPLRYYKLQMKKLWDVARFNEDKKSLRAEKALLTEHKKFVNQECRGLL